MLAALPIHDAPAPDARGSAASPPPDGGRRPRTTLRYLAGLDAERAPARHQDDGGRGSRAALEHGRRHADAGSRPGRPARSPTTSARRSRRSPIRRSTRSASGSSWTCGSSSGGGPALLGGLPSAPTTTPPRAPDRRRPASPHRARSAPHAGAPARRDLGPATSGPTGLQAALDRLADRGRRRRSRADDAPRGRPTRASALGRLPVPSVLAIGAVHTALTAAGLARPDGHPRRRRRRPRRPRAGDGPRVRRDGGPPAARHRARGRARRDPRRRGADQRGRRPAGLVAALRGRAAQDARADGHLHGRLVHRRRAVRHPRAGARGHRPLLPGRRGLAGARGLR